MAGEVRSKFAVELEDQTSGAANSAANALANLGDRIQGGQKALSEMRRAMRNLKGSTNTSAEAVGALQKRIDAQKASLASAQAKFVELGGVFGRTTKQTEDTSKGMGGLLERVQAMPGPIGSLASRFSSMGSVLVAGGVIGATIALAAGLVKVAKAAVQAAISVAKYAISVADARRQELLQLEGFSKIRRFWQRSATDAGALQERIDGVSASVAIGRDKVTGYAKTLERMGLRGGEAREALEVMSITASAAGERQARFFAGMAAGAARSGQSIKRLADDFRARFGPIAEKQMLSLSVQAAKFKENLAQLFSGLRIEGFLRSVKSMADLFSQNTASGRALKDVLETLLQPLINATRFVGPIMKRFWQGIVIGLLEVESAILKLEIMFIRAFGPKLFKQLKGLSENAGFAVFGLIESHARSAAAGLLFFGAMAIQAGKQAKTMFDAVNKLRDVIVKTDWKGIAGGMVGGLVKGIEGGIKDVIRSTKKLADSATGALRDALSIRSPSKVFAELGVNVSEGMAKGIDSGAPRVSQATEDMASVPQGGAVTSRSQVSVSVGDVIVHAGDAGDSREVAQRVRDAIAEVMEGVAIQMGAPA